MSDEEKSETRQLISYSKAVEWGTNALSNISKSPQLDSLLILAFVLKETKEKILAYPERNLSFEQLIEFQDNISRRCKNEPVAYLIGHKEFYGLDFKVTPDVLVPRPETELIVERVLTLVNNFKSPVRILDLGTGSGCIAIALAHTLKKEKKEFEINAIDKSPKALEIAEVNAEQLGVAAQINFIESDWCANIIPQVHHYDIIVSNPPYLSVHGPRDLELAYEPQMALYADQAGLADISILIQQVPKFLDDGGYFICELGVGKRRWVREMLQESKTEWEGKFHGQADDLSGCTILEAKKISTKS